MTCPHSQTGKPCPTPFVCQAAKVKIDGRELHRVTAPAEPSKEGGWEYAAWAAIAFLVTAFAVVVTVYRN